MFLINIIILFLIYSISGTLLHFLFKWSNNNIIIGMFSSVNESVWEHAKLLLTPIFIFSFINSLIDRNHNFLSTAVELILSIILIVGLYELKRLLFNNKYEFIYIISFYLICLIISYTHFKIINITVNPIINFISLIIVLIIFVMYLTFTIFPLKNKYFLDPVTNTYGIDNYVNKSV